MLSNLSGMNMKATLFAFCRLVIKKTLIRKIKLQVTRYGIIWLLLYSIVFVHFLTEILYRDRVKRKQQKEVNNPSQYVIQCIT